jgi:hypothetical protein
VPEAIERWGKKLALDEKAKRNERAASHGGEKAGR